MADEAFRLVARILRRQPIFATGEGSMPGRNGS
jgi:hypothetical protein